MAKVGVFYLEGEELKCNLGARFDQPSRPERVQDEG